MSNSQIVSNRASATVVKFPKKPVASKTVNAKRPSVAAASKPMGTGFGNAVIKVLWVCTVLLWTPLKWIISIDCVFKLIRMMYYWNTPGKHAGSTFLAHYTVLIVLTYFVRFYKPKGL